MECDYYSMPYIKLCFTETGVSLIKPVFSMYKLLYPIFCVAEMFYSYPEINIDCVASFLGYIFVSRRDPCSVY